MSASQKRLGVFGGAFDPPHLAHRALAEVALTQLQLDELRVLPTGQAWHKSRQLTAAPHRLAMARLAFDGLGGLVLDDREIRRAGPSYTLDTLRELQAEQPAAELFLVMGKDQADALPTWHDWQEIVRLAIICVADRDVLTGQETRFVPPPEMASRFRKLHMPAMDISATGIRARVQSQQGIGPLVNASVARYIEDQHLYSRTSSPHLMTTETAAKKDIQKLQRAIIDGLEDVKAQDIQVFNTEHLSPLFERIMIASGTSNRQTKALAASVRDAVREAGFGKPRMEGEENGEWIIVDCGQAVVHIMQPFIRQYYHLEDLWGDTPVRLKFGAEKPRAPAPAKTAREAKPATSMKRSSAAKKGVMEAYPSKAQVKKTAAKSATAKSQVKKVTGKKTAGKTPVKTIKVGKPPARKSAAKAPARKPAARKA